MKEERIEEKRGESLDERKGGKERGREGEEK